MDLSPLGLALTVAILAPNLILLVVPPGRMPRAQVPWLLIALEKAGRIACLTVAVGMAPGTIVWWWLIAVAAFVGTYWMLWARYLRAQRRTEALYAPLGPVPVPMALLPVLAFLAGSLWLGNIWLTVAALLFGAGHLPTSVLNAHAARADAVRPGR